MSKDKSQEQVSSDVDELSEDIIVVSPGQILSEARKKAALTPEQVAGKLNFRTHLVKDIESDIFDHSLPATFNRGYLKNYAKLVAVDVDEVLAAYDLLGAAEVQRSEMQSFSNLTEKQAEHSRLMWLSYLIVAILFGLMVLWWLQSPTSAPEKIEPKLKAVAETTTEVAPHSEQDDKSTQDKNTELAQKDSSHSVIAPAIADETQLTESPEVVAEPLAQAVDETTEVTPEVSTAVFTFSGDCWVNIYDATGERIAWGVKKSGYVMTISGKPPLKITLGKPELASIIFNGQAVDMTPFNVGNIAKFTLPVAPQN